MPPTSSTLVTHRDVFAGEAASGQAEWSIAQALAGRHPTSFPKAVLCPIADKGIVNAFGCGSLTR
jgi:hypothetical protein